MTAEIAILNKSAVALAADSAVTSRLKGKRKILPTANKLFQLSGYNPIGIMVYGNAEFMGIPWETIIKIYRENLENKTFPTLENYAAHFFSYIENNRLIFPESFQEEFFVTVIYNYFNSIKNSIDKKVKEIAGGKEKIPLSQIKEVIRETIEKHHTLWKKSENLQYPADHYQDIIDKFKKTIATAKKDIFQKLPISACLNNKLIEMVGFFACKKRFLFKECSGIVITGFGND